MILISAKLGVDGMWKHKPTPNLELENQLMTRKPMYTQPLCLDVEIRVRNPSCSNLSNVSRDDNIYSDYANPKFTSFDFLVFVSRLAKCHRHMHDRHQVLKINSKTAISSLCGTVCSNAPHKLQGHFARSRGRGDVCVFGKYVTRGRINFTQNLHSN